MLFRPVSVDELIDELAMQGPYLTDEHLARLIGLVGSLSGNKVSERHAGGGRVVSGTEVADAPAATVPETEQQRPRFERFERPRRAATAPRPQTIPEWAEANGYARPRGRPPRWIVEGWRKANPDAPELPIERKLRDEAARREPASYDVRIVEQPPEPLPAESVSDRPQSKNRCAGCGAKLSGGAKRYGHTKCAPCRIIEQAREEGAQSTGHMAAGKPPENATEIPPAEPQSRRSEPVPAQNVPENVPENVREKSPESAQQTGHKPDAGKRCQGCGIVMARTADFDKCLSCRRKDDADRQRSTDHEPLPIEGAPLSDHLERRCAGGCGAKLSRFNAADVCSPCQQKQRRERVETVRQGGVPSYPKAEEAPSRDSGVVAPRAKGEIVLSDGTIVEAAPGDGPRRDDQGRIICRNCNQHMSRWLACGCDEGELDDDGLPLDPRWQDGVFIPDDALASAG